MTFGLALSGGGFRASLFHLGSLARLAEADALRNVETISCVSGGSMIGMHYFLRLKMLLESKRDEDITREDYIEVVKDVIQTFTSFIQKNDIYFQGHRNPLLNIVVDTPNPLRINTGIITRVEIVASILEKLYRNFILEDIPSWSNGLPMENLRIKPPDEVLHYVPYEANKHRKAKIPVLIMNCTCLNTGHRFCWASDIVKTYDRYMRKDEEFWSEPGGWMGSIVKPENTSISPLKAIKFKSLPPRIRGRLTVGLAVTSSACVPMAFTPVSIPSVFEEIIGERVYEDEPKLIVALVDGMVSDNTGMQTLVDARTSFMFCSDGGLEAELEVRPGAIRNPLIQALARVTELMTVQAQQDRLDTLQSGDTDIDIVRVSLAYDKRYVVARSVAERSVSQSTASSGHAERTISQGTTGSGAIEPSSGTSYSCQATSPDADRRSLHRRHVSELELPPPATPIHPEFIQRIRRFRTHLDMFTEVECDALIAVAYLEAGIKLAQFAGAKQREQRDRMIASSSATFQGLPWSKDFLELMQNGQQEWSFLTLVPYLMESPSEAKRALKASERFAWRSIFCCCPTSVTRDRAIDEEETISSPSAMVGGSDNETPVSGEVPDVTIDDMLEMGSPLLTIRKHKRKYRKEQVEKDMLVRELDVQLHAASKFDSLVFPLKRFGYLCIGGHAIHSIIKWILLVGILGAFFFAYISVGYQLITDGGCTTDTKELCVIDWSWWFTQCNGDKKTLSTRAVVIIAFLILIGSYATGIVFLVFPFILGPLQFLCYVMHMLVRRPLLLRRGRVARFKKGLVLPGIVTSLNSWERQYTTLLRFLASQSDELATDMSLFST